MPTAEDQYVVHSALRDDMNEGWVWIRNSKHEKELDGKRRIVKLTARSKSIFCEALYADDWYMEKWFARWKATSQEAPPADENLAFISSWYRGRLGIIGNLPQRLTMTIEYSVEPRRPFWWQLYACLEHPQVVVLLATLLAVIGLGLGILALGLSVVAATDWQPYGGFWIGWLLVLSGAVVIACGLFGGWRGQR
ncbi:MAG: hypothetical protein ACHQZS_09590 [Candidatus Binatales bacterium]